MGNSSESDGSDGGGAATLSSETLALLLSMGLTSKPCAERRLMKNGDPERAAAQPLEGSAPGDAARVLAADGVVRAQPAPHAFDTVCSVTVCSDTLLPGLDGVLSAQLCGDCGLAVDAALASAVAAGRDAYTVARDTDFGNVDAPNSRWDMYLEYEDASLPYQRSFSAMLGDPAAPLSVLFAELFKGENGEFYELAALVSDRGAECQRVHPDATWKPNGCPLYTCFIALQDVELGMGSTHFIRGSHTEEAHASLRHTRDEYLAHAVYSEALLRKGDCAVMGAWRSLCGRGMYR